MPSSLKILWVKSGPLYPLDTGGKKRTHSMLVEMNRHHQVTYLAFRNTAVPLDDREEPAPYATRKVWLPWREAARGSIRWVVELLWNAIGSPLPYALAKYRSRRMTAKIEELCSETSYDFVVCDFLVPAVNFEMLAKPLGVPMVLFQHNIECMIWHRLAEGATHPVARWYFGIQAARMERWEGRFSRIFDGVITVSPEDSENARRRYGLGNVLGEVPAGVDTEYFQPRRRDETSDIAGRTIGFLGSMDWLPNIEGVRWFVDEVFPGLGTEFPDARFVVIGRKPPRSVKELAERDPRIEVTGTVDDVRPWLWRCDLLVVPLLSGGGTRIKIMEALAAGLPVVSTTVGAEGLGLKDGEHLRIADSAAEFQRAVSDLLADRDSRERLGIAGRELVEREFGWGGASDAFLAHVGKLALVKGEGRSQALDS